MPGMRALSERLAELAQVPSRIAAPVAARIDEQLRAEFAQGADPYGNPWKALLPSTVRRKKGDTRILLRSDELDAGTVARPSAGAGVEINSMPYGQFHQTGTKYMAKRKVLPDGADLPRSWEAIIEDEFAKAFGAGL